MQRHHQRTAERAHGGAGRERGIDGVGCVAAVACCAAQQLDAIEQACQGPKAQPTPAQAQPLSL